MTVLFVVSEDMLEFFFSYVRWNPAALLSL